MLRDHKSTNPHFRRLIHRFVHTPLTACRKNALLSTQVHQCGSARTEQESEPVSSIAFGPDGSVLATSSGVGHAARLWATSSGVCRATLVVSVGREGCLIGQRNNEQ